MQGRKLLGKCGGGNWIINYLFQPLSHLRVCMIQIGLVGVRYNVCRGSIMVTTSDFQSGRLGSSPSRDHYSMRLDRGTGLIRAFIPPG